jgi:hypothetical protein
MGQTNEDLLRTIEKSRKIIRAANKALAEADECLARSEGPIFPANYFVE